MTISKSSPTITLPYGGDASFAEMQAYGSVLQSFIRDQESQLAEIQDTRKHNETIDYLQSLASSYNEQLRIYKDTEANHQRDMMMALIRFVGN